MTNISLYRKMILGALACGGAIAFGAQQEVTITSANATAYSVSNKLVCDSGSIVNVQYSYRNAGTTLKAALLDFIEVTPAAAGEAEPWVSIRLSGDGLLNDVDFSEQPYLWLGASGKGTAPTKLVGTFVPYGTEYRLGYGGAYDQEYRGLLVTNLQDAADGTPRSVLLRGFGTTPIGGGSFSGGITAEGPACFSVNGVNGFGTGVAKKCPFVTLRNGARFNAKVVNGKFPANLGIHNEGTNILHVSGASSTVHDEFQGPISGSGRIRLTDQGGVWFTSANNTFTGELYDENAFQGLAVEIRIGDGTNCSWAGDKITQTDYTNHILTVNCSNAFTLNSTLSAAGGRLVKRGTGTLTLAKPYPRTMKAKAPGCPVLEIREGTLVRTQTESTAASGLVWLEPNATLDLNHVAATSVWLPYGRGRIVNPANGALTLRGFAQSGMSFLGSLEGKLTVENMGAVPWLLLAEASVGGDVALKHGSLSVTDGVCFTNYHAGVGTKTVFLDRASRGTVGLLMETWFNGKAWTAADHTAKFAEARALMASRNPDQTNDMEKFGEFFKSGEANATEGYKGPFRDIFGDTKDYFISRFSGYFIAPTNGTYAFRCYADDGAAVVLDGTNTIINQATGTGTTPLDGSVALTAGRHPVTFYFYENSGWEVFKVQLKKPGESAYADLPVSMLSQWDGSPTRLPHVTGAGTLELGSDCAWPEELGLADFSGQLQANAYTQTPAAGRVTPCGASITFIDGWDPAGTNWTFYGKTYTTNILGHSAVELMGQAAAQENSAINTAAPLDLAKPFTLSFDYSIHAPWGSDAGDGMAIVLHNGKTGFNGGTFNYSTTQALLGESSAIGIQLYLMPRESRFTWVTNNWICGTQVANTSFIMNNLKGPSNAMHVTFAWDLTNLVTKLEKGTTVWCSSNAVAGAALAKKFTSGTAYLGVWGRAGGYYASMLLDNFTLVRGDEQTETERQVFDGILGLTNGTTSVACTTGVEAELAADLQVVGAGTLATAAGSTACLSGDGWTFDLTNPSACLTLAGAFTFPASQRITVGVTGSPTPHARTLADLTGVADGAAEALAFELDPTCPMRWKLRYENGLLKIFENSSTVIMIR